MNLQELVGEKQEVGEVLERSFTSSFAAPGMLPPPRTEEVLDRFPSGVQNLGLLEYLEWLFFTVAGLDA